MKLEDVVIGALYTVEIKSASGKWEATKVCTPEGKKPYIEAIKYDPNADERTLSVAKRRSFDPDKMTPVINGSKKSGRSETVPVSKEGKVIKSFGEVQLVVEHVSFWPNHKKRGRPRKAA